MISDQVRVVVDSEGSRRDDAPRVSGVPRFDWERMPVRNFMFDTGKLHVRFSLSKIMMRKRRDIATDYK